MTSAQDKRLAKWSRRSRARPAEIIAAALALFAERRFAATKPDHVAKAAGISKGIVYLHFATKDDLFRAVVRQRFIPSLEQLEHASRDYDGASGALLHIMVNRVGGVMGSSLGVIPKLVLSEAGNFPEVAMFYADKIVARGQKVLDGILQRGVERGEFRPIDSSRLLPIFMGPLLLMLLRKHSFGRHSAIGFDHAVVLDAHIDILLRSLSPGRSA
jgi:AcrR family transcriptional regulator